MGMTCKCNKNVKGVLLKVSIYDKTSEEIACEAVGIYTDTILLREAEDLLHDFCIENNKSGELECYPVKQYIELNKIVDLSGGPIRCSEEKEI